MVFTIIDKQFQSLSLTSHRFMIIYVKANFRLELNSTNDTLHQLFATRKSLTKSSSKLLHDCYLPERTD